MPEILAVEMAALIMAVISIGAADFFYHSGRIAAPAHSLWVSLSMAAMCLPVFGWTAVIFVGSGPLAWGVIGALEVGLLVALYGNLNRLPALRKLGHGLPPPPEQSHPPATR